MVTLDNTVLNVAVPTLITDLSLSTSQIQWVVDAYSLVFAGLLLTAGERLGPLRPPSRPPWGAHGVRSRLACRALPGSALSLVIARGLMGVGGAFLMPATLAILVQVFDADERPVR